MHLRKCNGLLTTPDDYQYMYNDPVASDANRNNDRGRGNAIQGYQESGRELVQSNDDD